MKNLKNLRKANNLTQAEVAKFLNITPQAYAHYEQGAREPDITTCQKLAMLFGVSIDSLINGDDIKLTTKIPVIGVIPAGTPIEAIEDILDYEEISIKMANSGTFFALKVRGDSMTPTINDGDIVIVRQQNNADSGQICVITINGYDATLKEIRKDKEGIWILPHNPNSDFKPKFFSNKEAVELPIRILGVAKEIRRKV